MRGSLPAYISLLSADRPIISHQQTFVMWAAGERPWDQTEVNIANCFVDAHAEYHAQNCIRNLRQSQLTLWLRVSNLP
jgi:hypothetical protein